MTFLGLLQAGKGHLRPWDVLFGILQVLKEGLLIPRYALVAIGLGVLVALDGARLPPKETIQIGT